MIILSIIILAIDIRCMFLYSKLQDKGKGIDNVFLEFLLMTFFFLVLLLSIYFTLLGLYNLKY